MFTFHIKWIGCQIPHIMFCDGEIPPVCISHDLGPVGNVTLFTPLWDDKPQFKIFSIASYALCLIVDPYARVMLTWKTSTSHLGWHKCFAMVETEITVWNKLNWCFRLLHKRPSWSFFCDVSTWMVLTDCILLWQIVSLEILNRQGFILLSTTWVV